MLRREIFPRNTSNAHYVQADPSCLTCGDSDARERTFAQQADDVFGSGAAIAPARNRRIEASWLDAANDDDLPTHTRYWDELHSLGVRPPLSFRGHAPRPGVTVARRAVELSGGAPLSA